MDEIKMLGVDSGIYRDDGLMVTDLAPRGVEQLKKKLSAIFRKEKLEITIEANKKKVEFLDIYLDLDLDEYGPFRKPQFMFSSKVIFLGICWKIFLWG